jgi:branched-chain amino acid transport system permease protein
MKESKDPVSEVAEDRPTEEERRRANETIGAFLLPSFATRVLVGAGGLSATLLVVVLVGRAMVGASVMTNMLVAVVAVVGLGSFVGNSGILSFGHVGFVALGAYVSGVLTMPVAIKSSALPELPSWLATITFPLPLALIIALVVVAICALIFGIAIARPSGYAAAIATLGVLVVVRSMLIGLDNFTRGSQTFYGVPRETTFTVALVCAVAAIVAARIFRESPHGQQLRAAKDDELAARASGANVGRLRLEAWVLSAVLSGLAGVLLAHLITAFSPRQFYLSLTLTYLVMLIIGGAGTVSGAVAGAIIVMFVREALRGAESGFFIGSIEVPAFFGLAELVLALGMLLVLYFRPDGVVGVREPDEMLIDALNRRKGRRRIGSDV